MAVLHPVVGPASHLLLVGIAKLGHRRLVGAQAIGGDGVGTAVALERLLHEGHRRGLVAGLGDKALEDLAFVIDRAPQVAHLAVHLHVHLVEVPLPLAKAPHAADPLPADVGSEHRAEPVPPVAHRLVADVDPALVRAGPRRSSG